MRYYSLFLIPVFIFIFSSISYSDTKQFGRFSGKIEVGRDESGRIFNLIQPDSKKIYLCNNSNNGYFFDIANTDKIVTLEGNVVTFNDGSNMFEDCNFKLVNNNGNNLYGPKIFGLQLGMSYKESKPIVNDICTKYGNPFMKCEDLSGVGEAFGASKTTKIFGDLSTVATWDNNILVGYTLPLKIFNYNNTIDKRTFLEKLASSYNLNFNCDNNGICKGSNNYDGYEVEINLNNEYIKIEKASKISDLEFK